MCGPFVTTKPFGWWFSRSEQRHWKPWGCWSKTLTPTPEPAGYCAGDVAGERGVGAAKISSLESPRCRCLAGIGPPGGRVVLRDRATNGGRRDGVTRPGADASVLGRVALRLGLDHRPLGVPRPRGH